MGKVEKRMIRQAYATKRPLPDNIKNAPDLFMGLELYFHAFTDLNTCRNSGWSAGPIPATAIDEHCDRLGLTPDENDEMHYFIRRMDEAFLKYSAKKNKEKS